MLGKALKKDQAKHYEEKLNKLNAVEALIDENPDLVNDDVKNAFYSAKDTIKKKYAEARRSPMAQGFRDVLMAPADDAEEVATEPQKAPPLSEGPTIDRKRLGTALGDAHETAIRNIQTEGYSRDQAEEVLNGERNFVRQSGYTKMAEWLNEKQGHVVPDEVLNSLAYGLTSLGVSGGQMIGSTLGVLAPFSDTIEELANDALDIAETYNPVTRQFKTGENLASLWKQDKGRAMQYFMMQVGLTAPQFLQAIALTNMTGSPSFAIHVLSSQAGGQAYLNLRKDKTLSEEQRIWGAVGSYVIEFASEHLVTEKILERMLHNTDFVMTIGQRAMQIGKGLGYGPQESLEEGVSGVGQTTLYRALGIDKRGFDEAMAQDMPGNVEQGLIAMPLGMMGGMAGNVQQTQLQDDAVNEYVWNNVVEQYSNNPEKFMQYREPTETLPPLNYTMTPEADAIQRAKEQAVEDAKAREEKRKRLQAEADARHQEKLKADRQNQRDKADILKKNAAEIENEATYGEHAAIYTKDPSEVTNKEAATLVDDLRHAGYPDEAIATLSVTKMQKLLRGELSADEEHTLRLYDQYLKKNKPPEEPPDEPPPPAPAGVKVLKQEEKPPAVKVNAQGKEPVKETPTPITYEEESPKPKTGLETVEKPKAEAKPKPKNDKDKRRTNLSNNIYSKLKAGEKIGNNRDLRAMADEAFGGTMADGTYTSKDLYDATEAGVNQYLAEKKNLASTDPADAWDMIDKELLAKLPTQNQRTGEKELLQQFSTPPHIAQLANYLMNPQKGGVVLEPSAGTGGLAIFARMNPGVTVHTNEIDALRKKILKEANFPVTSHDARFINALFPKDVKFTSVIMNPPFSSDSQRGTKGTNIGFEHTKAALNTLAPNGRAVIIMGESAGIDRAKSRAEWADIAKNYNVVAHIGIPGESYRKYGTSFGTMIAVVDNTGPTPGGVDNIPKLSVKDMEEARNEITKIRNSAPRSGESDRLAILENYRRSILHDVGRKLREAGSGSRGNEPGGRRAGNTKSGSVTQEQGTNPGEVVENVPANKPAVQQKPTIENSPNETGEPTTKGKVPVSGGTNTNGGPEVKIETKGKAEAGKEEVGGVFTEYVPAKLKTGKRHTGNIVETSLMASTDPPDITYKPHLPEKLISSGKLFDTQLEAIVYAGQAHSKTLPSGERMGISIGDGTGTGKGRLIAGIILDNFNQGRKRAIWLSVSSDLMEDAKRDFDGIDANIPLRRLNDFNLNDNIDDFDGTIFSTYATMISGKETITRLKQIADWLGDDGVIVFDEAHKLKNAISDRGIATQTGTKGVELQSMLPKARIVYSSATGATEVRNMGYMTRLGLWGYGTQFSDFNEFMNAIESGGTGMKELIARELKSNGLFFSRMLSLKGVEVKEINAPLSKEQRKLYDVAARAWQIVIDNIDEAIKITNTSKMARSNAKKQLYNGMQRFFNQLITIYKVPAVIEATEKALRGDKSVVISIENTFEAALNDAVARARENGLTMDEVEVSPKSIIINYLEKAFPTVQYAEEYDPISGTKTKVPVVDEFGAPVENPQAVQMREDMIAELSDLSFPSSPIDQIINHFGEKNVAELTGRSNRMAIDPKTKKMDFVKRAPKGVAKNKVNLWEMKNFQDGKKRVAIISPAAGTGISLHADKSAKNQQKRVMFTIQYSWSADSQLQKNGRIHRTNQAQLPEYAPLMSDVPGESRFVSTIVKRMESLGALSSGSKKATNMGEAAKYNYESKYGADALEKLYKTTDEKAILKTMGILREDNEGRETITKNDLRDVKKFMNRIMVLEMEPQTRIFNEYLNIFDDITNEAKANGTFDDDVQDIKGVNRVETIQEKVVNENELTGAKTNYVELDAFFPTEKLPFSSLRVSSKEKFYKNKQSGHYAHLTTLNNRADPKTGELEMWYAMKRYNGQHRYIPESELKDKWEKGTDLKAAETWWNKMIEEMPEEYSRKYHLLTGQLLPYWAKLNKILDNTREKLRVIRIVDANGKRHLGVRIPAKALGAVQHLFDIRSKAKSPHDIFDAVWSGSNVDIGRDWYLRKIRVHGEDRIEMVGPKGSDLRTMMDIGLITEKIDYKQRYFVPTNREMATPIINNILKYTGEVKGEIERTEHAKQAVTGEKSSEIPNISNRVERYENDETVPIKAPTNSKDLILRIRSLFPEITFRKKFLDRWKKGVTGKYIHENLVKTRNEYDVESLAHEIAHYWQKEIFSKIDEQESGIGTSPIMKEELRDFDYDQKERRISEGFAEFVQYWIRGIDVTKKAPTFAKYFEEVFIKENDKNNRFEKLKKIVRAYTLKSAQEVVESQAGFGRSRSKIGRIIQLAKDIYNHKQMTPGQKIVSLYKKARSLAIDDAAYVEYALKVAMGKDSFYSLMAKNNPITLYRAYKQKAGAIAESWVMRGASSLATGDDVGRGIKPILKDVQRVIKESGAKGYSVKTFLSYLYSKHSLDWINRSEENGGPLNPGISKESALAYMQEIQDEHPDLADEFDKYGKEVTGYFNNLLREVWKAGGLSNDAILALLERYPNYIPMYRDVLSGGILAKAIAGKAGLANQASPIKKAVGSEAPLENMYEAWYKHTERMILWALKARIMKAFADLAKVNKNLTPLIRKTQIPVGSKTINMKDVEAALANLGMDIHVEDMKNGQLVEDLRDVAINLYFAENGASHGTPTVTIWENGKRNQYELHPDLYNFVLGLNAPNLGDILKVLSRISRGVRIGATVLNPEFLAGNIIRDTLEATFMSQKQSVLPSNVMAGLLSQFKLSESLAKRLGVDPEMAELYGKTGTVVSTMAGMNRSSLNRVADRLYAEVTSKGSLSKVRFGVFHPFQALQLVGEFLEAPNRIAEFSDTYKKVLKQTGGDKEEAFIRGARAAQDVTVDFARSGVYGREFNAAIPFFNAGLQGTDKFFRSFFEKETTGYAKGKAVHGKRNVPYRMLRGVIYLAGLSLLAIKFRDDDEYEKLSTHDRFSYYNFWINSKGKRYHLQLPIPFNAGALFHSALQSAYTRAKYDDKKIYKDYANWLVQEQMLPLLPLFAGNMPAGFASFWEIATNKDFAGRPIEPYYARRNTLAKDIRKEQTTQISKFMADVMFEMGITKGLSPVQIDHLIDGFSGGTYTRTLSYWKAIEGLFTPGTPLEPSDLPIIKAVVRSSRPMANKYVQRYYDLLETYQQTGKSQHKEALDITERILKHIKKLERKNPSVSPLVFTKMKAAKITSVMRYIQKQENKK